MIELLLQLSMLLGVMAAIILVAGLIGKGIEWLVDRLF